MARGRFTKLTDEQIIDVYTARESPGVIANRTGIGLAVVESIRYRRAHTRVTNSVLGVAGRKPQLSATVREAIQTADISIPCAILAKQYGTSIGTVSRLRPVRTKRAKSKAPKPIRAPKPKVTPTRTTTPAKNKPKSERFIWFPHVVRPKRPPKAVPVPVSKRAYDPRPISHLKRIALLNATGSRASVRPLPDSLPPILHVGEHVRALLSEY